jgi:hypothetical protein
VSASADSIVQVNAWATWTATQPCISNCSETIGVSFQFDNSIFATPLPSDYPANPASWPYPLSAQVVPGTLIVGSSGFLGSFSGSGGVNLWNVANEGFTAFFNAAGDEIDLWAAHSGSMDPSITNPFPVGVNTIGFTGWACKSQACLDGFGPPGFFRLSPTMQASLVAPVAVPEAGSWSIILLTTAMLANALWRRAGKRTP